MDPGLEMKQEEPGLQAPKRQAVGQTDRELKRVIAILAKQTLSNAQRSRAMMGFLIQVFQVRSEGQFALAAKAATKVYADAARTFGDNRQKVDKIGLPHIHVWNAMIATSLEVAQKGGNEDQVKLLKEYVQVYQPKGWRAIGQEVEYARLRRNYDKQYKALDFRVVFGTPSFKAYEVVKAILIAQPGTTEMPGQAPPGNLERELQRWLEENGFSTIKEGE